MSILGGPVKGTKKFKTNEQQKKEKQLKKENKKKLQIITDKLKSGKTITGKTQTKAQRMALERRKAKLEGTYTKPKTAQELAKERIRRKKAAASQAKNTSKRVKSGRRVGGRGGFTG